MSLSLEELRRGITYWRKTKWPRDFHNRFYEVELSAINSKPLFTDKWWSDFFPILSRWRATRPRTKEYISSRAIARFPLMQQIWDRQIISCLACNVADLSWDAVKDFASVVSEIKNVNSPVFTSKFCHFLAPRIFPVLDSTAMYNQYSGYREYYQSVREEWLTTNESLRDALTQFIGQEIGPICRNFPIECKLVEICLIGRRQQDRVQ